MIANLCGYAVTTYQVRLPAGPLAILGPADPDALLDDPRTEHRFYAENEHLPYWARLWPAAVMLAEHVERLALPTAETALEIGCGLGLAGLAAARRGWKTTVTDYDADALAFVRASAGLNGLLDAVQIEPRDWRDTRTARPVDLLLAADVLFEERWIEPIAEYAARCLTTGMALVADPNRRTAETFAAAVENKGLTCTTVETTTDQPDGDPVAGIIYVIRRP